MQISTFFPLAIHFKPKFNRNMAKNAKNITDTSIINTFNDLIIPL